MKSVIIVDHYDASESYPRSLRVFILTRNEFTVESRNIVKVFIYKNDDECISDTEREMWSKENAWKRAEALAREIKANDYKLTSEQTLLEI